MNINYKLLDHWMIRDIRWETTPKVTPPDGPAPQCCGRATVQHFHDGAWFWECFKCGKETGT